MFEELNFNSILDMDQETGKETRQRDNKTLN